MTDLTFQHQPYDLGDTPPTVATMTELHRAARSGDRRARLTLKKLTDDAKAEREANRETRPETKTVADVIKQRRDARAHSQRPAGGNA